MVLLRDFVGAYCSPLGKFGTAVEANRTRCDDFSKGHDLKLLYDASKQIAPRMMSALGLGRVAANRARWRTPFQDAQDFDVLWLRWRSRIPREFVGER